MYGFALAYKFWQKEFKQIDFSDVRLKKRLMKVMTELGNQPLDPINKACGGWHEAKAAYRFFANDKVQTSEILDTHAKCTRERIKQHPLVFIIQDTTYLNYTQHWATEGLGKISNVSGKEVMGLIQHTTLAVDLEGVPLGILHQKSWAREKTREKGERIRDIRLEEKESMRWLEALDQSLLYIPKQTHAVTIADRECDIFDFMAHAGQKNASFLIRASINRAVYTEETQEIDHLWESLKSSDVKGIVHVHVPKNHRDPQREAKAEVRFKPVEIKKPSRKKLFVSNPPPTVFVYAVWVKEMDPPENVTPLEWMLLTNTVVENLEDALEKVAWYKLRWGVENFHKVLKSGCRVQECRLATADRLIKYLTIFSIIAWRLYWLTHINRQSPEAKCNTIFERQEWQALYCKIKKTHTPPQSPPSVRDCVRWIAQLGGFLARKGDKEPGMTTIWRGWQRFNDITEDWLIFHEHQTYG